MSDTLTQSDLDHIETDLQQFAVPIDSIMLDPANARKHNEKNLASIRGSLSSYKQRKLVVVNKRTNCIEAGNGTYTAGKALGWKYIAVLFVDDDPMTAAGFAIADNRTAELAEWDEEVLMKQLEAMEPPDNEDIQAMFADLIEEKQTPDFTPAPLSEQGKLDSMKLIHCPECGHEFKPEA